MGTIQRMKYKVIEKNLVGKRGMERCEDAIVTTSDFVAVIDGSTSKSQLLALACGRTPGQMAARIVSEVIQEMPADITIEHFVDRVNDHFHEQYAASYGEDVLQRMQEHKEDRWTCSLILYSVCRHEIWMIGDCQGMLVGEDGNMTELNNDKPYETVLAKKRSNYLKDKLIEGSTTVDELRLHDMGRDLIIPQMLEEMKNQNVTYAVLDGFAVAWRGVRIIPVVDCRKVILASDGYPRLFPTLDETERYLQHCLQDDPLMIHLHPATKAWMTGNESFDDRCYIGFQTSFA